MLLLNHQSLVWMIHNATFKVTTKRPGNRIEKEQEKKKGTGKRQQSKKEWKQSRPYFFQGGKNEKREPIEKSNELKPNEPKNWKREIKQLVIRELIKRTDGDRGEISKRKETKREKEKRKGKNNKRHRKRNNQRKSHTSLF